MVYRCSMCVGYLSVSLTELLDHLRRSHSNDPNFHVLCGLDGCPRTYKRVVSFRNHLIRKHNIYGKENEPVINNDENPRDMNIDDENDPAIQENDAEPAHVLVENMQRDNALCLFGFKDKGRVTQTVVNLFAESSMQMVRNSLNVAKSEIKERLAAVGQAIEDIPGLQQIFEEDSSAMNPLHGIETEQKQHKYHLDHFNLVEPRKIVLRRYHVKVRRGRKLKVVEKTDDAFYIPLLESLQQLLNDEAILEEVENSHARDDGYLSDFCDTDYFKDHPLFGVDPYALQLLLYFDELEVCNPLGSRANKHKLGALYYTLGNIKPCNRSHMNAIQLLGLVTCKHLKLYGIQPLLEAFMEDLHKLEQDSGYMFIVDKEEMHLRGTLAYVSADNLGAQYLGGFKQGSQSHRKCRECMGINDQIQSMFCEDCFVLRERQSYEEQCERLVLGEHFQKTYGLNNRSILNDSRYYHVVGGLPADAMHDILEGVLHYTIKEVLKVFIIDQRFFSLDEMNSQITSYDYGYHNDTNKPSPIQRNRLLSNDNSLKQHANQMWCLALHLPLLVGDYVPEDDEHWKLLCTLLEITRIVFAPTISKNQVAYLQILIQEHHEKFKELFPQCNIIPKMHYMIHMPRTILRFGPLVRSWCMRYEAKHHYFKRLAVTTGNFINLPYTLSKRHQESVSYRLQASNGSLSSFIEKGVEIGPGTNRYAADVSYQAQLKEENGNTNPLTPVYEARWVTIHGTKYKVGAVIHIGYNAEEFPLFWKIEKIAIINKIVSEIMFIVSQKETLLFNKHYQCYEVVTPTKPQIKVTYFKDFSCYLPLSESKAQGDQVCSNSKFICVRYDLDSC